MYDSIKIIFEKDGQEILKGEVLPRDNPETTADYLLQNFWTMHEVAQESQPITDDND